jgi:hypothetical protein
MMTATDHPLVRDYLARLREEARGLPVDQARELEADITEHLEAGLGPDPGEAAIRDALDRLGSPTELVAEAAGPVATPPPVTKPFASPVGAIACLVAAELLSLLVPIALVLWVVGLVLLARATVWTEREKVLGFFAIGTGFFVGLSVIIVGLIAAPTGGPSCESVTTSDGTSLPASCTSDGGGFNTIGVVVAVLLAAYLVFQVVTIWRLTRSAGRSAAVR